jgi:hypothetical protein
MVMPQVPSRSDVTRYQPEMSVVCEEVSADASVRVVVPGLLLPL